MKYIKSYLYLIYSTAVLKIFCFVIKAIVVKIYTGFLASIEELN